MVRLSKVKAKSKSKLRVDAKKKTVVKRRLTARKIRVKKNPLTIEDRKNLLREQEMAVGTAKFSHAKVMLMQDNSLGELPFTYGRDKMILAVRDPWWLYTYWEVKDSTWERIKAELKDEFYKAKRVLRVYDVSNINFNGTNAHRFFDILIRDDAQSWYIDASGPGKSWCVDLGLLLKDGRFVTILRSNVVESPLDGPSWITDEEWMIPDDIFSRLYGMGLSSGKGTSAGGFWRKESISSPGIASMASPVRKQAPRSFWLEVNCELIVYGATEPDAKVTVQNKSISLRRDGTFTLRFALPNGKQVIPVKAVSKDNLEERTITPIVNRETK